MMRFEIQPVIFQDENIVMATIHDADLPGVDGYIGMVRFTKEQWTDFRDALDPIPPRMLAVLEPKYYTMHKKAPQPGAAV